MVDKDETTRSADCILATASTTDHRVEVSFGTF